MSDMPADPFGPPEELLTMMRGYSQLYSAAVMGGLPEHVATQFISNIFMAFFLQNAPQEEK